MEPYLNRYRARKQAVAYGVGRLLTRAVLKRKGRFRSDERKRQWDTGL